MLIEASVAFLLLVQDPEPTATEPQDPAVAILQAADEATRAVTSVRYDATWCGTGVLAGSRATAQGAVTIASSGSWVIDGLYFDPDDDGDEHVHGTVRMVFDGTTLSVQDDARKTVTVGQPNSQTAGPGISVFMIEYIHPTPFQDEINGTTLELEGRTLVGDVVCDVVFVEYGGVAPGVQARWYFGVDDHLPRRVERLDEVDGRPGALVLTIENLEVGVEPEEGTFTFDPPEDYQRRRSAPSLRLGTGNPAPSS